MRFAALLAFTVCTGSLLAQHVPVINPSRGMAAPPRAYPYGNILFPGGTPPMPNNHAARLGGTIAGGGYTGVGPGPQYPVGGRPRTVVVPYAVPVFMGGYGYAPEPVAPNVTVVVPQQPVPNVIINNNYVPERPNSALREYSAGELPDSNVRVYEGPKPRTDQAPAARSGRSIMDEKATIYLIALKDGSLRQAIGYWVQGDTLHYVTPDASINRLSGDIVDVQRSTDLNRERNLDFDLRLPQR
jgi:hypothetical protein